MDSDFGPGVIVGAFAVLIFMVIVGLSGGFDPVAYCPDGQAAIKVDGRVTQCAIFPPATPPGFVPAPGAPLPSTAPTFVPPLYK